MEAAVKTFFSAPHFAVAGASSDPSKFGHKVFAWYLEHSLPVTPMNPSASSITCAAGSKQSYSTVPSIDALPAPKDTALSVITPPKVTKTLLEQAKAAGLRAVWLQPGTFDSEILEWARKEWPDAAIAGTDVPGSRGGQGWCVLVDGDWGLELADRKDGKL